MRVLPLEEIHDELAEAAMKEGSWAVVSVPKEKREATLDLLRQRYPSGQPVLVRDEDPSRLCQGDLQRELYDSVRRAMRDGRMPAFVTDDATWEAGQVLPLYQLTLTHLILKEEVPRDRRKDRRGRETQASVVEWGAGHYPEERGDLTKKVRNLVEEVAELVAELGQDVEEMAGVFRRSAARPKKEGVPITDIHGAAGEVGDSLLALYEVADAMGVQACECLDGKMVINRAKSPEESQARAARKREIGI